LLLRSLPLAVGLLISAPVLAGAVIQPGEVAPGFTLVDKDGTGYSLSDFRGKVVLLNFIGFNCQPCIQAAIAVEALWQDFSGQELMVLALDVWNGNESGVQSFVDQTGVTFPVLRDAAFLSLDSRYGLKFDNFVVIDADGIVRYTSEHEFPIPYNEEAIRQTIDLYLPSAVKGAPWSVIKGLYR